MIDSHPDKCVDGEACEPSWPGRGDIGNDHPLVAALGPQAV